MSLVKEIKDDEFKAEVIESSLPVLVDFWAPWCGPCRMVAPVVEAIAQKMENKVKFVKINTDSSPKTAQEYGIMAIPSLLVFKNGEEVDRIVGFMPEEKLEEKLKEIAGD